MVEAGAWRELAPRRGPRIDGLVDPVPVADNDATLLPTGDVLHLAGAASPWGYLARLRLRPGVVEPAEWTTPMVVRITAEAVEGRLGAICVGDDLQTVLSNAVEWCDEDGVATLSLVVYTFPGQGWLVFRTAARAAPQARLRVLAVEVFAMDAALPAPEAPGREGGGRMVIFTTITNHYDTLKPPRRPDPECDYVCFTDDPGGVPPPWRPVRIRGRFCDPRLDALWYRVHAHLVFPLHDVSVYFDGRFEQQQPILPLARAALAGVGLAVLDNPWSDCVYQAGDDDVRHGRDAVHVVAQQLDRYRRAGFPRHLACLPPGFLMRRHHDPEIVGMATTWWNEIQTASYRDELSFTYVIWQRRVPFRRVWLPVHDNPWVRLGEHNFVDYYRTSSTGRRPAS